MIKKRILFYSSVNSLELFKVQRFYSIDIQLLERLGHNVALTNKICDFLLFWKYDISFLYFYKWSLFPAILSKLFFKKVYLTGGIDELNEVTTSKREYLIQVLFFKLCYLFSDTCLIVSKSDFKNIKKIYNGKYLQKLYLSFHTINYESFHVEDLLLKNKNFTTVGWMESVSNVKRKGIDKSLILFEKLIKNPEFSDSKFYIIGKEGEGALYLKKLCRSLNISNKVVFTGFIDENQKSSILKSSKYYFQLSTFEGFGIAAIEALAAKNIVIHSGNGGLSETMINFGIKINLNGNLEKNIDNIVNLIVNYRSDLLFKAHYHIIDNYTNEARENDFLKIIQ
jgi:glycosyltransferase involved in cell wall biosynthesis